MHPYPRSKKQNSFQMKRLILLASLSVLVISYAFFTINSPAHSQELVFKRHGNHIRTLSLEKLQELISPVRVEVFEPLESIKREYIGFPVDQLLTIVYGDGWKSADDILFTCKDGYQPVVPTQEFMKYHSYLVYDRPDNEEFTLINERDGHEPVNLGPFYLVWDNIKFPEIQKLGFLAWPYQVITIDLIDFSERFPHMAPPKNSSHDVKSGFNSFRMHCMSCHTINGEGAKKAKELNYPVNVTEYIKEPWLRRWINNPRDISYNSTMPALDPNVKDRESIIENIISYLKIMKDNKHKPET